MALSAKQATFVSAYIGEAKGNATEAARIAGYKHPGQQGHDLLKKLEIKAAIDEHMAEVKRQGIALRENRVEELANRHKLLKRVIAERAESEYLADVPGGSTGLVVKQLKSFKHVYERDPNDPDSKAHQVTVEQWESSVDTGLLRELREHERQIAQELGEWTEKSEIKNTGAVSLELIGVKVPLPPREDASEDDS